MNAARRGASASFLVTPCVAVVGLVCVSRVIAYQTVVSVTTALKQWRTPANLLHMTKQRQRVSDAPATPTPDRLITAREVCARSTLSRTTIWRLVRAGELPAPCRLTPTRIAWRESEILAWMAGR